MRFVDLLDETWFQANAPGTQALGNDVRRRDLGGGSQCLNQDLHDLFVGGNPVYLGEQLLQLAAASYLLR